MKRSENVVTVRRRSETALVRLEATGLVSRSSVRHKATAVPGFTPGAAGATLPLGERQGKTLVLNLFNLNLTMFYHSCHLARACAYLSC